MIIDDRAVNEIAEAVVMQAVRDWRRLCRGEKAQTDCNFHELDSFFTGDCHKYISNPETVNRIHRLLQRERRAHEV